MSLYCRLTLFMWFWKKKNTLKVKHIMLKNSTFCPVYPLWLFSITASWSCSEILHVGSLKVADSEQWTRCSFTHCITVEMTFADLLACDAVTDTCSMFVVGLFLCTSDWLHWVHFKAAAAGEPLICSQTLDKPNAHQHVQCFPDGRLQQRLKQENSAYIHVRQNWVRLKVSLLWSTEE